MNANELADLVRRVAVPLDLDPVLVRAVAMVESAGDPFAIRYEPGFYRRYVEPLHLADETEARARATSWGLLQVMGQVARERGFGGRYLSALCDPETGLYFGALHLKAFLRRHGDETLAVASYNAGSPRYEGSVLVNQKYVDKVMGWKRKLAAEG